MASIARTLKRCVAAVLAALASEAAIAQTAAQAIPRTADGHPDLQGVWESRWITPLEPLPWATSLNVDEAEAKALLARIHEALAVPSPSNPESDNDFTTLMPIDGKYRTGLIIDPPDGKLPYSDKGRPPPWNPASGFPADNPEEIGATVRCIGGMRGPMVGSPTNAYILFVQTPEHIALHYEPFGHLTVIRPGAPAPVTAWPTLRGDSSGHWEDDTLVIETRNSRDDSRYAFPGTGIPISPKTVLVERFTRVSGNELRYRFTLSDPDLYIRPWTAELIYLRTDSPVLEYGCHEHNYAMTNILLGARVEELRGR